MNIKRFNDLILEKYSNSCDGCKYFDFDSLKQIYGGYHHPVYYLIRKQQIEKLEYIDPEVYLHIVVKNMKSNYKDAILTPTSTELVQKYVNDMKNGAKFPIGFFINNSSHQEGRHRALAMIELGCKLMPIIEITYVKKDNILEITDIIKDLTRDQLNQFYIDKGYDGVTDLDWRSLQEYIKYGMY